jgi:hypothetical protein
MMQEAERRQLPYLFKLRQSPNVKKHIARILNQQGWQAAGGDRQGVTSELQRSGWNCARRVVVLSRLVCDPSTVTEGDPSTGQAIFAGMVELKPGYEFYEYAVLVTSLANEVLSLAQLYRDRAEAENILDELKNQWGWTGFTTQDLQRCQILARIIGLIYNWWSLYTRLAIPNRHTEASSCSASGKLRSSYLQLTVGEPYCASFSRLALQYRCLPSAHDHLTAGSRACRQLSQTVTAAK